MTPAGFRNALAAASVGAALVGEDQRVVETNAAFAAWLGYSHDELRGVQLSSLFAPDGPGRRADLFSELASVAGVFGSYERSFVRRDGTAARASITTWLPRSVHSRFRRAVILVRDAAPDNALSLDVVRALAHEVRNPIAAIGGAIEVIRDRLGSDAPEREIFADIGARLRELDGSIDDLVMLAQLPTLERRRLAIADVLEQAGIPASIIESPDSACAVVLVDLDLLVRGLRGVVREVRNTDADATVTVEVQDAACAVDVKAKRSAAERLLRTTPLAVVMAVRIVRAHGGDLDIAPPRRPGAALSIRLPLAPMEAREPLRTARVTRVR